MLKIILPTILVVICLFTGGSLFLVWKQIEAQQQAGGPPLIGEKLFEGFSFGKSDDESPEVVVAEAPAVPAPRDTLPEPAAEVAAPVAAAFDMTATPQGRFPDATLRAQARGFFLDYKGQDTAAKDVAAKVFNGMWRSQEEMSDVYKIADLPDDVRAMVNALPENRSATAMPVFAPPATQQPDMQQADMQLEEMLAAAEAEAAASMSLPQATSGQLPTVRRGTSLSVGNCRIEKGARRCTVGQ